MAGLREPRRAALHMRFLIFYYLIVPVFILVGGMYFVFTSLPPSSIVIEAGPAGGFFAQTTRPPRFGSKLA